jgi:hypothetical protein
MGAAALGDSENQSGQQNISCTISLFLYELCEESCDEFDVKFLNGSPFAAD